MAFPFFFLLGFRDLLPLLRIPLGVDVIFTRLLWIAMLDNRTCRVNRRMRHSANLKVVLMIFIKLFPMLNALYLSNASIKYFPKQPVDLAFNSLSVRPRKSCVRCVLKQPVPNARAPSTPALKITSGLSNSIENECDGRTNDDMTLQADMPCP